MKKNTHDKESSNFVGGGSFGSASILCDICLEFESDIKIFC